MKALSTLANTLRANTCTVCMILAVVLAFAFAPEVIAQNTQAAGIGGMASERATEAPQELGGELTSDDYKGAMRWVKVLALVLLSAVLILLHRASNMVKWDPSKRSRPTICKANSCYFLGLRW